MKIVGLDFGEKRVGIAVSVDGIVVPKRVITVKNETDALEKIVSFLHGESVEKVVVGLPLTVLGKAGRQAEKVKRFAVLLHEKLEVPVELFDERFSTSDATSQLRSQGISEKQMRGKVDALVAALLLESYESSQKTSPHP